MPIYEYRCELCANQFEVLMTSISDQKEVSCPECNSTKVEKTISAGSFRLAGSGGGSVPLGSGVGGCGSGGSGFS